MMRSMIEEAVEDAPVVLTARTWVMMAGVYDHYGKDRDGMMEELERRERNLERRERELERNERELEKRQKHHEREDEMYRKGWFGEREIRDEYDSMDPYMRRGRRSRYY